jgi:hypothetical protein
VFQSYLFTLDFPCGKVEFLNTPTRHYPRTCWVLKGSIMQKIVFTFYPIQVYIQMYTTGVYNNFFSNLSLWGIPQSWVVTGSIDAFKFCLKYQGTNYFIVFWFIFMKKTKFWVLIDFYLCVYDEVCHVYFSTFVFANESWVLNFIFYWFGRVRRKLTIPAGLFNNFFDSYSWKKQSSEYF